MTDISLVTGFLEAIKNKNGETEEIKNFEIKDSDIHGKGVFATKKMKPGEFINVALFKGKSDYHETTIFGAHINHSKEANARTRFEGDYYRTYSASDINPGDEITVDYTNNKTLEQPEEDWE
ncbi:SET domain-containing protein-lysine N-methyltransferase [Candidatus Pacearchaeota archaeon]|nr:SET domain-containing protein-lysine N-methyltransferase [Candidatus Pacearchaeota archaeon]